MTRMERQSKFNPRVGDSARMNAWTDRRWKIVEFVKPHLMRVELIKLSETEKTARQVINTHRWAEMVEHRCFDE